MKKIDLRWALSCLLLTTLVACESGADRDDTAPAAATGAAATESTPAPALAPTTESAPESAPAAPPQPAAATPASPPAAAPEQEPPPEADTPGGGEQSPTPTPAPAQTAAEVPRVPVGEARSLVEAGRAVIVDVRDPASFANSHIAGAIHIPLGEIETRFGELPRDRRIITYCA
jgi:hypothetical protein